MEAVGWSGYLKICHNKVAGAYVLLNQWNIHVHRLWVSNRNQTIKHYLLTWYDITDLRAAVGFEELGGPVLAALWT